MKYYLIFVKHINDGTEARECLGITDIITAKATMYNKIGSAMNDPNCDYAFAAIKNYLGLDVVDPVGFKRPEDDEEVEVTAD